MTSKLSGERISAIAAASTYISLKLTPGCPLQTFLQALAKTPSLFLRTFDLWTATTLLPFFLDSASPKARSAILSDALRVIRRSATAPPSISNSIPLYRPSVFSLTITRSAPGASDLTPGSPFAGLILA